MSIVFSQAQIDYLERAISDIIGKIFDKHFGPVLSHPHLSPQHSTPQAANATQIKPTKQRKKRRNKSNKRRKHTVAIKSPAKNIRVISAIPAKPLRNCRDKDAPKLVLGLLLALEASFSQTVSRFLIETAMRAESPLLRGTFELLFRHDID